MITNEFIVLKTLHGERGTKKYGISSWDIERGELFVRDFDYIDYDKDHSIGFNSIHRRNTFCVPESVFEELAKDKIILFLRRDE